MNINNIIPSIHPKINNFQNYFIKRDLSSNTLKVLAIIAMFLDHLVTVFIPQDAFIYIYLRILGRIAAPIMCYMIAEGYYYTSNLKKYINRLLIFSLISHIPYNLCFGFGFFEATSVIWGLTLGLIALSIIKSNKINSIYKLIGVVFCCLLSIIANWNYVSVLWIIGFGVFRGDLIKQMISFIIIGVIFHFVPNFTSYNDVHSNYYQLGVFLAIPILLLYKGRKGRNIPALKWGFYAFYPLHLLLIYFLRIIFLN